MTKPVPPKIYDLTATIQTLRAMAAERTEIARLLEESAQVLEATRKPEKGK